MRRRTCTARAGVGMTSLQGACRRGPSGRVDDALKFRGRHRVRTSTSEIGDGIPRFPRAHKTRAADHPIGAFRCPALKRSSKARIWKEARTSTAISSRLRESSPRELALQSRSASARRSIAGFFFPVPDPLQTVNLFAVGFGVGPESLAEPCPHLAAMISRMRRQEYAGWSDNCAQGGSLSRRESPFSKRRILSDLRPAPAIDRLVVIADAADIAMCPWASRRSQRYCATLVS